MPSKRRASASRTPRTPLKRRMDGGGIFQRRTRGFFPRA
jgi:hypothetical protein